MATDEQRAEAFESYMVDLYAAGLKMINGYARLESEPLPPLPEWEDLPNEARAAFALQTVDMMYPLMVTVRHIATVIAEET